MMMMMKTIMFKIVTKQHTPHYYFTYGDVLTLSFCIHKVFCVYLLHLIPSLPAGYAMDFEDIFAVFPALIYERIIQ